MALTRTASLSEPTGNADSDQSCMPVTLGACAQRMRTGVTQAGGKYCATTTASECDVPVNSESLVGASATDSPGRGRDVPSS
jgi:hypothetical protein